MLECWIHFDIMLERIPTMPTQRSTDLKARKLNGMSRTGRRRGTKSRLAMLEKRETLRNVDKWNKEKQSGTGKNAGGPSRTERKEGTKTPTKK